jgi:hypothetical protein
MEERIKLLESKVDALSGLVELLMRERQEKIEHEIACLRTLKEWEEWNKAEEAKKEALESEAAAND